ncbi:MAG TPA: DUF433 domain-containing protein [Tepidisphaeraceae bacterium]|nr:DUF433 domain-containing protein [Tepidisphaeraceae bacterium]
MTLSISLSPRIEALLKERAAAEGKDPTTFASELIEAVVASARRINKTPGVSGGAARVGNTRLPVWTLVQLKKLNRTEEELMNDFPSLSPGDLDLVWAYYRDHTAEIDAAIAAQQDVAAH